MLTEDRQTTFIRATRSKMVSQTKDLNRRDGREETEGG